MRVSYRIFGGGGKNVHRATPSRGVWGDAPPGNFRNLHALRLASGAPKWLEISY